MKRVPARWRLLSSGPATVVLLLLLVATPASAVQTFPDPFGGDGTHTDLRAGSKGEDIGDVFLLHDGPILRIRIFLDSPNSFIESHVCLSADPFTERVPPGQCQYQESGAASDTYDITLPPSDFPEWHHAIHRSARPRLRPGPCLLQRARPGADRQGRRHRLRRLGAGRTVLRQHLRAVSAGSRASTRRDGRRREDRGGGSRRRHLPRHGREPDHRDRPGRHARGDAAIRAELDIATPMHRGRGQPGDL